MQLILFHHQNYCSSLDLDDFCAFNTHLCYLLEIYMVRFYPFRTGCDQRNNTNTPKGETMSKMLKGARPAAEAAVISVAIVIAALAIPAAILYAAV